MSNAKCPYCKEDVEGAIVCRGCGAEAHYEDGTGFVGFILGCVLILVGVAIGTWWGYLIAFVGLAAFGSVGKQKKWSR